MGLETNGFLVLLNLLALLLDESTIFLAFGFLGLPNHFWLLRTEEIVAGALVLAKDRIGTTTDDEGTPEANPNLWMNLVDD